MAGLLHEVGTTPDILHAAGAHGALSCPSAAPEPLTARAQRAYHSRILTSAPDN
jgi:hypothetical protein